MTDAYALKIWQRQAGGFAVDNRQVMSASGSTTPVVFIGPVRMSLSGDFGGGTAQLRNNDGTNNVDVANGAFTAVTDTLFDFPAVPNTLNVALTGSSAPALVVRLQSTQ
jgi:hypothetical protein